MPKLEIFTMCGCNNLRNLPLKMDELQRLGLFRTAIKKIPQMPNLEYFRSDGVDNMEIFSELPNLGYLSLNDGQYNLPEELRNLRILKLYKSNFKTNAALNTPELTDLYLENYEQFLSEKIVKNVDLTKLKSVKITVLYHKYLRKNSLELNSSGSFFNLDQNQQAEILKFIEPKNPRIPKKPENENCSIQ